MKYAIWIKGKIWCQKSYPQHRFRCSIHQFDLLSKTMVWLSANISWSEQHLSTGHNCNWVWEKLITDLLTVLCVIVRWLSRYWQMCTSHTHRLSTVYRNCYSILEGMCQWKKFRTQIIPPDNALNAKRSYHVECLCLSDSFMCYLVTRLQNQYYWNCLTCAWNARFWSGPTSPKRNILS